MCDNKIVLTAAALLLVATGFCIYQANWEKKLGQDSEIKI